jgi:hypothetical protein
MQRNLKSRVVKLEKVMRPGRPDGSVFFLLWGVDQQDLEGRLAASKEQGEIVADDIAVCVVWPSHEFQQWPLVGIGGSASVHNLRKLGESIVMERKVICDLNLISVDFGREEELQPGNIFRITFRHVNGERTGAIDVYQGEAEHFALELEAVAAFLRAALSANKKSN